MVKGRDLAITAVAPLVWGSTYLVTATVLPPGMPLTTAVLRVLPVGLALMAWHRCVPRGRWLWRVLVLSALNIAIFQGALFVAAYRLPGGVAATLGAIQPLLVALLGWPVLAMRPPAKALLAGAVGVAGVGLLALTPAARLDGVGVAAALIGAASMALGITLGRRWTPPASVMAYTSWQLVGGGLLLAPAAMWLEPPLPTLTLGQWAAYAYLGLIGAGLAYFLWFRGITRMPPSLVAPLGLLSPLCATVLGWAVAGQSLSAGQMAGAALVLGAVGLGTRAGR
ncbi:MAG TPA: EamA family transporter [Magnetospirillum sp.]|nr:EamA family transporter [Magnetospirillum sp.]